MRSPISPTSTRCCRTAPAWVIATVLWSWAARVDRARSAAPASPFPGTLTTAYLTLRLYEPDFEFVVVPFDQIQQAVLEGKADTGLLIHEGQLTYAEEGLQKVVDLGEWWADHTGGLPLPLGGNIIRRDLGPEMIAKVSQMLHDSIAYALSNREQAVEYAIQFGRGLDRERTDTFVGMYVNNLTLSYGERGKMAVERLLAEAYDKGLIPQRVPIEFAA